MNKKEPFAFLAGQFDNLSNHNAHYLSSGPEILNQLNGNVDGLFVLLERVEHWLGFQNF